MKSLSHKIAIKSQIVINPFAARPISGVCYWIWADRGPFRDHFGERIFQKE